MIYLDLPTALAAERHALIARAETEHEPWPQYAGHWDNWLLAEAVRPIVSKWGDLMAEPGDRLLMKPTEPGANPVGIGVTVYLDGDHHWSDSGTNTVVPFGSVKAVTA